jgi:hypothetical protein
MLLVTATSYTQTNSSQRIFKSPDGTFMFRYPSSVVLCQPQYDKPTPDTDVSNEALEPRLVGWAPDSCGAHMPICPTSEVMATDTGPLQCAGINRHEAEDESSLRERSSDPVGLESCAGYREVHSEA